MSETYIQRLDKDSIDYSIIQRYMGLGLKKEEIQKRVMDTKGLRFFEKYHLQIQISDYLREVQGFLQVMTFLHIRI